MVSLPITLAFLFVIVVIELVRVLSRMSKRAFRILAPLFLGPSDKIFVAVAGSLAIYFVGGAAFGFWYNSLGIGWTEASYFSFDTLTSFGSLKPPSFKEDLGYCRTAIERTAVVESVLGHAGFPVLLGVMFSKT